MKTIISFFILTLFLTSLSFAQENNKGKELFETKCNQCHSLNRVLNITKDLEGWIATTKIMAKKSMGRITDKEAKELAKYLASRENKTNQK